MDVKRAADKVDSISIVGPLHVRAANLITYNCHTITTADNPLHLYMNDWTLHLKD
jgi:hypothetical protein